MSKRYCSWCWGVGHNSATCPGKKKHIEDNPYSYEAKREAKKLERRKNRKQTTRKCGFCRKPGHNAKTCHTKKTIQEKYAGLCSAYRRKVLEEMCVMGLGVGALVNFTPRNSDPILAIVKDIHWDRVYPASDGSGYCIQLERLGPIEEEEYYRHWAPNRRRSLGKRHLNQLLTRPMMGEVYQRDDVYQRHLEAGGPEVEVVSPVSENLIAPPSDWLEGKLSTYDNENPFRYEGKNRTLWDLQYEMHHFAYFSGVLGMKESEKYFSSFF